MNLSIIYMLEIGPYNTLFTIAMVFSTMYSMSTATDDSIVLPTENPWIYTKENQQPGIQGPIKQSILLFLKHAQVCYISY